MGQAFQGLSTTDNGSVLYFSTPDFIAGSTQSYHSKIFRWDSANGFQLVADVPDTGTSDGCTTANFYQLSSPQVSGDGTILAYMGSRPEAGGRYCNPSEPNQGILQQNGQTKTLTGSISLSPAGRYAITTPLDAVTNNYHFVTDLLSGSSNIVSGAFNGDRRRITDDGAVLSTEPSALLLTDCTGATRVWQTQLPVNDAIVDRAGATLVYLTQLGPNNPAAISTIDVSSGTETQIFGGFAPGNLALTADGKTLLFTNVTSSGPVLYLMTVDGSNQRQIGNQTVSDAILSGDGTVIYANSTDGRLLQIDVASGAATEISPAAPLITAVYRPYPPATTIAAVGSLITLFGPGPAFTKQVTFCGQPVALVGSTYLQFQVPWNTPPGPCYAIVQTASPFESAVTLTVQEYDPQFFGVVYHGSNWMPVTEESPAHRGEVLVTYMTGLGPVDQNGLLTNPGFSCQFDAAPAGLLYAGLAPDATGFYQLNIQAPDVADLSPSLRCGWNLGTEPYTSVWLEPN